MLWVDSEMLESVQKRAFRMICPNTDYKVALIFAGTEASQAAQSRCTVVRPMQKSIGKWEIRPPPCKIVTVKNFILKLCTYDYVREITRHANFGFNRCNGGFSPNRRNITTL